VKDYIWIERFWRTIKYDYIYIPAEEDGEGFVKESFDSWMTIAANVASKGYQASSACGRLLDIN